MRLFFSKFIWGVFFLLVAVFLLVNQYKNFTEIGIGSLIGIFIAFAIIVNCFISSQLSFLPVPLAILYIVLQEPLGLPVFQTWTIILAALLMTAGLSIILPKRNWKRFFKFHDYNKKEGQINQTNIVDTDPNNFHFVKLNFGAISRRLHSNNLEKVTLECKFGAMEIFFDKAQLSPNGAEIIIDCSMGAVVLYIPKEWRVIDNINCSLGGVDMSKTIFATDENAPKLTLTGSVSIGGIEVKNV